MHTKVYYWDLVEAFVTSAISLPVGMNFTNEERLSTLALTVKFFSSLTLGLCARRRKMEVKDGGREGGREGGKEGGSDGEIEGRSET